MDGLYMHIPFCFHKCHYCDFFSVVDNPPEDSGVKVSGFRGDRQAAFGKRVLCLGGLRPLTPPPGRINCSEALRDIFSSASFARTGSLRI